MDIGPVHPLIIHLPIALSMLNPLIAFWLLIAIAKKQIEARCWVLVIALQGLLCIMSWVAEQTGTQDMPLVVAKIGQEAVKNHNEWAEIFAQCTWVVLLFSSIGFLPKKLCAYFRIATVLSGLGLIYLCYQTGTSGGELVYKHGAARTFYEQKK